MALLVKERKDVSHVVHILPAVSRGRDTFILLLVRRVFSETTGVTLCGLRGWVVELMDREGGGENVCPMGGRRSMKLRESFMISSRSGKEKKA